MKIINKIKRKDRNSNIEFEIRNLVENFIEKIEITKIKGLDEVLVKIARYFANYLEFELKNRDESETKIEELIKHSINYKKLTDDVSLVIKGFIEHIIQIK